MCAGAVRPPRASVAALLPSPPPSQPRPRGVTWWRERDSADTRSHSESHTKLFSHVSSLTGQLYISGIPRPLLSPPRGHLDPQPGKCRKHVASFGGWEVKRAKRGGFPERSKKRRRAGRRRSTPDSSWSSFSWRTFRLSRVTERTEETMLNRRNAPFPLLRVWMQLRGLGLTARLQHPPRDVAFSPP